MRIFVTGGAGYIGSITTRQLLDEGYDVEVFDSLEYGHIKAVDKRAGFQKGDLSDVGLLTEVIKNYNPDAVIHFAGYIESGESMSDPLRFFRNNFSNGLNLLDAMRNANVERIIFSSTAGVYGDPDELPIKETSKINPTSYYSMSKYFFEEVLKASSVYGIRSIILRYFNAAGASLDGKMGQDREYFTHLVPNVILAAVGKKGSVSIFGDDYGTKDGTCVRDYIHVEDLATSHVMALQKFQDSFDYEIYNVGVGVGYTVKEVIDMVKKVSGKDFKVLIEKRRPGDWEASFADSSKIRRELGWKPKYGLKEIVETAYRWHSNNPQGYRS